MESLYALGRFFNQTYFIPKPTFTDKELPDQFGKVRVLANNYFGFTYMVKQVHIITGGYAGIGYELAKILYSKNATIYVAGRSASKAEGRIASIKSEFPNSKGRVEFLFLDLADLGTIKASAQEFLSKEKRLDVLTNNAGVMIPPDGSKTKQGYELQTGTHVYGHFLFTVLLEGVLKETAKVAETGTVRVTWASSSGAELMAPSAGVEFNEDGLLKETHPKELCYGQSKAANILQGVELAKRWGKDGIISNVSRIYGEWEETSHMRGEI